MKSCIVVGAERVLPRRRFLGLVPRIVGTLVLLVAVAVRVMDLVSARIRERIV
ncbi:MAG: hypothetical protein KJ058_04970 [Thermoanaerobaculia bacterium]|nr:hypothetical protein [Thermoanaerobaculia bacterium]